MYSHKLSETLAAQDERARRWQEAYSNGPYTTRTKVKADDIDAARVAARELLSSWEGELPLTGIRKAAQKMGRIFKPGPNQKELAAVKMLDLASSELTGNVELAQIEIESGLLEPYNGSMLAFALALDIQGDNFDVIE